MLAQRRPVQIPVQNQGGAVLSVRRADSRPWDVMTEAINTYSARVRAHQTDVNGSMYHGAFFDLFDDARIETFRRLGYDYARMQTTAFRPIIRRVECEYFAPAFMDELLTVTVSVPRMSAATLTIRYECRRADHMLAVAQAVFAFVDERGKPGRIPTDLRQITQEHFKPVR